MPKSFHIIDVNRYIVPTLRNKFDYKHIARNSYATNAKCFEDQRSGARIEGSCFFFFKLKGQESNISLIPLLLVPPCFSSVVCSGHFQTTRCRRKSSRNFLEQEVDFNKQSRWGKVETISNAEAQCWTGVDTPVIRCRARRRDN